MEKFHLIEPGLGGLRTPGTEREWVWHPGIARVCVVLNDQQATSRPEDNANPGQNRPSIGDEMEAVSRKYAVERPIWQAPGEVGQVWRHPNSGTSIGDGRRGGAKPFSVPVDRLDGASRAEHVGEGCREGPIPGSQFEPSRTGVLDAATDQRDMISVIHGRVALRCGRTGGRAGPGGQALAACSASHSS